MTRGNEDPSDRATATPRRLADFIGHWHLGRRIDPASGPRAQFEGAADWTLRGDGTAIYAERGELRIAGQTPVRAERRLIWGADLNVWFADGRPFHTVPATGGVAEHLCPPDHYRVWYDFSDWPAFQTTWQVEGPRKSYRMVTRYRR
ncbi:MAG: DUF6314 family protein [Marinibacterium sp.]